MALLRIRNLSKFYKDTKALRDVSFNVEAGEFVTIIGRSGAGKSTLLRCINRMIDASGGSIIFDGMDVCSLQRRQLRKVRTNIGMVFQHYNLVHRQSVLENVLHGRLGFKSDFDGVFSRYAESEKRDALNLIHQLGLDDQTYKRCDKLSGGQKQRVGIARALIQKPKLILCDEPIASLDPSSAKVIMDHLKSINRDLGITILVNLHQVDVAVKYGDRILGIKSGQVAFDGNPKKLGKKDIHEIYGTESGELIDE